MVSGWRYRVTSALGVAALTAAAVVVANHPFVQRLAVAFPVVGRLHATTLADGDLTLAAVTAVAVSLVAFAPLFKPRPRRLLDTLFGSTRRVFLAAVALAAVGYFDYTYRLPRTTLILAASFMGVLVPLWFVAIRRRPTVDAERAVIVGDDPATMADVLETTDVPVLGYVSPPSNPRGTATDGGQVLERTSLDEVECLGGLSRLGEVFVRYDVDTGVLAFARTDRAEFFGTLDTCFEYGVTAKTLRDRADCLLTTGVGRGELIDVDLEPWDVQDRVLKRAFDVVAAACGLLVLSPLMAVVAVAIELDSAGPVLYRQNRTAEFGDTFPVYKFRSMVTDAETDTGAVLSDENRGEVDPRVTRVGRVLRATHLDELPQLWSVLVGDMSVVGPRPERPELDDDIQRDVLAWQQRWFVRPGLTGLAQIHEANSTDPGEKLRYDVAYIRNQSLWFDLHIFCRQLWMVAEDAVGLVR